jgi:hypothetical protein
MGGKAQHAMFGNPEFSVFNAFVNFDGDRMACAIHLGEICQKYNQSQ